LSRTRDYGLVTLCVRVRKTRRTLLAMFRIAALFTAFGLLSASPALAMPSTLVLETHTLHDGYELDLYITDGSDGRLTEATLTDPATGDVVDVWSDGETIHWHGTVDGETTEGSMLVVEIDPQQLFCLTPATAIICIGAILIATGAGCKHGDSPCGGDRPTEVPGGAGGVPGGSGEGGGGDSDDGDGDGD
ncbi:MAG: hypothetical protein R6X02_24875, partial [Enhygromyxa sp.]